MNDPIRIPVLVGSVRRGRQSIKPALFASKRLTQAGYDAPILDLAEFDLPIMEERLAFRDDPPSGLVAFSKAITEADALVVVSPEYHGSIPGVLKNALDYIRAEWARKPIGIVTVSGGGFGGVQVHTNLQLLFLRVKALPVAALHVSQVAKSFADDGEPLVERYEKGVAGFIETLGWYARVIGEAAPLTRPKP